MNTDIELRHLRYFTAVAEELHFGRAAKRLYLAQPALSQQIRKLEEIVGAPLFLRTSRSVALTAAGEIFLERTRRTLRNVQHDVEEARSIGRGESGSLNVGFIGSGMLGSLPAVLHNYRAAYPRVQLQLHESFTSRVVTGLTTGVLDAGLLRDSDPHPDLHTEVLFSERFIAVLPADHPRATQRSIAAPALRHEPFVFHSRSAGALAWDKPLSLCGEAGFRPRVVQEASNWVSILQLIAVGFGVSIAPECVRSVAMEGVVCLPLRGATEVSNVELAYRKGETRPIVQSFAQIARSVPGKALKN
jgi:DNA-binding transcriptional LysR family regulator